MDWKALFKSLFHRVVWSLLVLLGAAVLALLKVYWPAASGPTLYGLLGAACVLVIHFGITGRPIFSKQQPQTTPENVEANIRAWLANVGLAARRQNAEGAHFLIVATMNNGNPIGISRPIMNDRYLLFQSRVALSPEHQVPMEAMGQALRDRTLREITLELARARIGYGLEGPPFRSITIQKASFITSSLTEDAFVAVMDEMDSAISLARVATVLAIERNFGPIA